MERLGSFSLRGARRDFEEHVSEPPSAQPDAVGWAGTVGMGVGSHSLFTIHHSLLFVCRGMKPW